MLFSTGMDLSPLWHLPSSASSRVALILLNGPAAWSGGADGACARAVAHLWPRCAAYRVAADGAANSLLRALPALTPDAVVGDFDSLRASTGAVYAARGAVLRHEPSQEAGDLTKALEAVEAAAAAAAAAASAASPGGGGGGGGKEERWRVIVWGGFGGRFDSEMSNVAALYAERWARAFAGLVLLGEHGAAQLLCAGRHELAITTPVEGPLCGLIPLGAPCAAATTTGLHWDLRRDPLAFGGLVSTSNWIELYPYRHICAATGVAEGEGGDGDGNDDGGSGGASSARAAAQPLRRHAGAVTVEASEALLWTVTVNWRAVFALADTAAVP